METPSSTRRVTRSQALASSGDKTSNIPMSRKLEGTVKGCVNSRQETGIQQDRFVLIDISNDSPIVGLAMGSLETSSSTVSKKSSCAKKTASPGSGEILLREQVKTLLQKIEEEAEISKISVDDVNRPFRCLKSLVNSPMGLLAPTPNNTPHVSNLSTNASEENNGLESALSQTVTEVSDGQKKKESDESENLISRCLLFDFSEKLESSCDSTSDCTSVLMYQGSKVKSCTNDDSSNWSIQVNASTKDDDAFKDEVTSEKEEDEYYDVREEEDYCNDDAILDDLCEGLSKVSCNVVEFAGKHTRFVYNSDDELEGVQNCDAADEGLDFLANGVLRLKGMPTPKGKHLRFPMED